MHDRCSSPRRALLMRAGASLIAVGLPGAVPAQTPVYLRVTAVPGESPTEVARRFAPLGRYLAHELEMRIEWVPSTTYEAAVDGMVGRSVDLALLGGYTFVLANARSGGRIIPLVQRDRDASYRSVFITRADSGILRLEQLKGRTFSFGPAQSTSGHLMPRASLMAAKIDPVADLRGMSFSSGHDATVAAVLSGKADAGALHNFAWEKLVAEKQVDTSQLHVFFTSPPYHDTNWSVHADMPAQIREAIKAAFLKIDRTTPEGQEILRLQTANRYQPTRTENYNGIKAAAENAGLLK